MKEGAPLSDHRHYTGSPTLVFLGNDLYLPGDPEHEEQFYTTLHLLESMTSVRADANTWQQITPQTVQEELAEFNQTVRTLRLCSLRSPFENFSEKKKMRHPTCSALFSDRTLSQNH
jgi:hypothetical protein